VIFRQAIAAILLTGSVATPVFASGGPPPPIWISLPIQVTELNDDARLGIARALACAQENSPPTIRVRADYSLLYLEKPADQAPIVRALALVRDALIEGGIDPSKIQTGVGGFTQVAMFWPGDPLPTNAQIDPRGVRVVIADCPYEHDLVGPPPPPPEPPKRRRRIR
jgi:hypothetical protein